MIEPKLTLIGAGPGDPELITLKAIKSLSIASVVLYDALASEEILNHCKSDAIKIFVGKRRGGCKFSQAEINEMIVHYALIHGNVVRLKGGDPFVFGRGYEEMEYASNNNIKVEVIPGISSAIAVPEMLHIPLTSRGLSESFWVTTGTTQTGEISKDIAMAAQSSATLVILMAMSKLEEITQIFIEENKSETPVAVIHKGTTKDEKFVIGKVKDIVEKVKKANIDNPSVIVIGEVARLHKDWKN
ncbi:MAG: uroporphyrinogen-III C-methyltransferase [Bacteroidota bacterium]|nr:uroporphyrinogen-III C-methyltransferase [Bacteroidota bacterium]